MAAPEFLIHATEGWARYYGSHHAASVTVMFAHLLGLVVAAGTAVAVDREVLASGAAATQRRDAVLARVAGAHPAVLGGLAVMFASGLALALADVETFWDLRVFWVKLGLIAALLVNGAAMKAAEAGGVPRWGRVRASAAVSLVLWSAIVLASVILAGS